MDKSKEFLDLHDHRLSFKDKQQHTFELVNEKMTEITDNDGQKKPAMKYRIKENGKIKDFTTISLDFIKALAQFKIGDLITAQLKSKSVNNQFINYYDVSGVKTESTEKPDEIVDDMNIDAAF